MGMRKHLWGSALFLLFLVSPVSQASLLSQEYTSSWASNGFFPVQSASFRIGSVRNETGHGASFDMPGYLQDQTRQQLTQQGFKEARPGTPATIVIDLRIHLYQEGSTFGRWLGGGSGAAYAVVYAAFRRKGGASADLLTVSVIGGGGLFSAGAAKTVLEDAAKQVATYLKQGGTK